MNSQAESLNHRIRNAAAELGVPPLRLRNRIAFQRILARLSRDSGWVLKGGFSLEVRFGLLARATKDLDVERLAATSTAVELQDALDESLSIDLGDGFTFLVRMPKPMRREDAEPSTWRAVVDVSYLDTSFGTSVIDVVPSPTSSTSHLEELTITTTIVGDSFTTLAIDIHRHTAEKLHAYARIYAYDAPSSRVKDLVDLVLIAESEVLDSAALLDALREVFAERRTPIPDRLPEPPADWEPTYTALMGDVGHTGISLTSAWQIAADLFERALEKKEYL